MVNDTQIKHNVIGFHQFFENYVSLSPESIAITLNEDSLTYFQLNQWANQIAYFLLEHGVGIETFVGLCMDRSFEMIACLLGILKTGGAYVPLDPQYPTDRLSYMITDSGIDLLLTQSHLISDLENTELDISLINLADLQTTQYPTENPTTHFSLDNPAYIIYTSGSTGLPKGVVVPHLGLSCLIASQISLFQLTPADRILQLASLSFDAATFEIVMALGSGATLYLGDKLDLLPGPQLLQLLQKHQISIMTITPSALAQLPNDVYLPNLRVINVAGEVCSAALVDGWGNGRLFFNLYGPTETTIWATYEHCHEGALPPPIGKAIPDVTIHVLDDKLKPVSLGEVGEIYIGGVGVTRGYWRRAGLTAVSFIPDPFTNKPGSRLYKSGDLARLLPTGKLDFMGRVDDQVKIRGIRVELGEIENRLSQHPAVSQATARIFQHNGNRQAVVGYIIPQSEQSPSSSELRRYLTQFLPEHMVPETIINLPQFPTTPNGKLDRQALPAPSGQRPDLSTRFVAPQTEAEQKTAAIWSEILGVEKIGIYDDFFELGGHSLAVTQVAARIRTLFSVDMPLVTLFEQTTVAQLAVYLGDVPRQTHLLQIPPLKERLNTEQTVFPLSFSQERVWFMRELLPDNRAYNAQSSIRFRGALNIPVLEKTLSELVQRHEIWRTTFSLVDNWPMQHVHSAWQVQLPVVDLSHLPVAERETAVEKHMQQAFNHVFDTTQLPLLHFLLLKLADDDHILVQVEHHFIHDGWSFSVQQQEFKAIYTAFLHNENSPLPPAVQFVDFVLWQRDWLQGDVLENQLIYWKKQLSSQSQMTEILTDYPRAPIQTLRGDAICTTIPADFASRLRVFSRTQNATLFMTLLAGLKLLLVHYTDQTDIIVGSSVANRRLAEIEQVIGMIVNNLVLRTDLSGNPTFREIVSLVRQTALQAYDYQDIPFERIVETIQPERDLSRNPFFQIIFNFHDAPVPLLDLPDGVGQVRYHQNNSAKFDLNIVVIPQAGKREDGSLQIVWEYNSDLFAQETMQRMIDHYLALLDSVITDPDQKIGGVSFLSEIEKQQLLVTWNKTETKFSRQQCIHQIFEQQAMQTPHATALLFADQIVTYQQLNQRANQLAHYLRRVGVGSEVLVGLFLERSPEMIISMLAILKAGGGYLPLDIDSPQERLALMLEDTKSPVLLTQAALLPKLPSGEVRLICLDKEAGAIALECMENMGETAVSSNLAYVMYTSGSTGQPKGISIIHQNVVRLVKETNFANLSADETFLQVAPASFDAATFEIWGSLLNGAKLVIFPPHPPTLSELGTVLREQEVTTLWLTAGLFHLMVDEQLDSLRGIRQLLAGGDVLSPAHVQKVVETLPNCRLINGYGPTENTTFTTCHPVSHVTESMISIPIGRPIANTQVYILDARMQPVPVGVAGELFVGGAGLARNYLNRPRLTAERFVPHPFSRQPGARLYGTGDLVRYRPDGSIEFLGRRDHQVKLRGFRIELGEIEVALSSHPAVQSVVVTMHNGAAQGKQLVAYISASSGSQIDLETECRSFLQKQLPAYMIPTHFVGLEHLPLTANGKIDYQALPSLELLHTTAVFTPPETLVEEIIAEIWCDVLSMEQVSIHDNFFELGGHSLLVTQVVSRVEVMLDVTVSLLDFFEAPTIAQLAETVEDLLADLLTVENISQ